MLFWDWELWELFNGGNPLTLRFYFFTSFIVSYNFYGSVYVYDFRLYVANIRVRGLFESWANNLSGLTLFVITRSPFISKVYLLLFILNYKFLNLLWFRVSWSFKAFSSFSFIYLFLKRFLLASSTILSSISGHKMLCCLLNDLVNDNLFSLEILSIDILVFFGDK